MRDKLSELSPTRAGAGQYPGRKEKMERKKINDISETALIAIQLLQTAILWIRREPNIGQIILQSQTDDMNAVRLAMDSLKVVCEI